MPIFYMPYQNFKKRYVKQTLWEQQNSAKPTVDMITWSRDKFKKSYSRRLQSPYVMGIHVRLKQYHSYMSRDVILLPPNLLEIHTRIRGYYSFMSRDLIRFHALINEERHITTLTKSFKHQIWKTKKNQKQNEMNLFVRFKDYIIQAVSWN